MQLYVKTNRGGVKQSRAEPECIGQSENMQSQITVIQLSHKLHFCIFIDIVFVCHAFIKTKKLYICRKCE